MRENQPKFKETENMIRDKKRVLVLLMTDNIFSLKNQDYSVPKEEPKNYAIRLLAKKEKRLRLTDMLYQEALNRRNDLS